MDDSAYATVEGQVKLVDTKCLDFSAFMGHRKRAGTKRSWLEVMIESESSVKVLRCKAEWDIHPGDTVRAYVSLRSPKEKGEPAPIKHEHPKEEPIDVSKFTLRQLANYVSLARVGRSGSTCAHCDAVFEQYRHDEEIEYWETRPTLGVAANPFKLEVIRNANTAGTYEDQRWW